MQTKRSSKAGKASKNRAKRIPSVKRLNPVRTLKTIGGSMVNCGSDKCQTR